jgi:hypothetical protein
VDPGNCLTLSSLEDCTWHHNPDDHNIYLSDNCDRTRLSITIFHMHKQNTQDVPVLIFMLRNECAIFTLGGNYVVRHDLVYFKIIKSLKIVYTNSI